MPHRITNLDAMNIAARILTEAVRIYEDAHGVIEDPHAEAKARSSNGDFEARLMERAHALEIAPSLTLAMEQLRGVFRFIVTIGLIIAVATGASTAGVVLSSQGEEPVNFFWVLAGVLGVHMIALLIWLALIVARPDTVTKGSLGHALFSVGQRITKRLHRNAIQASVVQAAGLVYARDAVGRWALSKISHALWLAFLFGCLLSVIVILSITQFTFMWETTILSDATYVAITENLAVAPGLFGFTTPTQQEIIASHWTGNDPTFEGTREAWSGLLIGSIVVYGLLPRFLLVVICFLLEKRAGSKFRLDTALPGYARLQDCLAPLAETIGVVDADSHPPELTDRPGSVAGPWAIRADGPTAIMGFEIDQPKCKWPPLDNVAWLDLGLVDTRSDRQRALEQIRSASPPPRLIVMVCSMTTTPDRGIREFMENLQQATSTPVAIVLTEGQRLRARGHLEDVAQRSADWRRLAEQARIEDGRVIEVDLDHLTGTSLANLANLVGTQSAGARSTPRLEQSFAIILDHLRGWRRTPDAVQQAELHRAIGALYKGESSSWQSLLGTQAISTEPLPTRLRTSAERMVDLLPARLRTNPRWLAAGATAGAMGCVAAATLVTPAAIAALPLWAGLGAAISAALPHVNLGRAGAAPNEAENDFTESVRSAALFALLLELQGRDESTITRIIDQVADHDDADIDSLDAARSWLDALSRRFHESTVLEPA